MRGLCPRAPGIYRFRAKVSTTGRRCRPYHFGPESALESHPCLALSSSTPFHTEPAQPRHVDRQMLPDIVPRVPSSLTA